MKKRFGIFLLTLFLVASFGTAVLAQKASNPATKVYKDDKVVKVFVGRPSGPIILNSYKDNRSDIFKEMVEENPNQVIDSLIVFNEFVTANQIEEIFDGKSLKVKRIWLAEPGTVGAGDAVVKDNNIKDAVLNWSADFQQFYSEAEANNVKVNKNTDSMFAATRENRVEVYSVLVSASIGCLNEISNNSLIDFTDIHYDQNAEKMRNSKDYKVKYIDVPKRPDGIS